MKCPISSKVLWLLCLVPLLLIGYAHAKEGTLSIEAQLVWGTNDEKSPNPKHKSVEPVVAQKLNNGPFKWKRYFEEERKCVKVPVNGTEKLEMSKSASIELKNLGEVKKLGKDVVEVTLIGDGNVVAKHKGPLVSGEIMVIGGDAKNDTAWFIILRQVQCKK